MIDLLCRTPTFTALTMRRVVLVLFAALLCVVPFHAVRAQTPPDLGAASQFAVLAGTTITCTTAIISGDVGVNLGGSVGACTVLGTIHTGDALAVQAYGDFLTAYAAVGGVSCTSTQNGTLAGLTLAPGVYCLDPSAKTGLLTLNGPPDGIWIFKTESSALTTTSFQVVFSGGAPACTGGGRVFWWSSAAATFTDSNFMGTVLAGTSATVTNGNFNGQLLAKSSATLTTTASFTYCAPVPPVVPCPTITVNPATLPNPTVGLAYSQTISATGGTGPYSYAVTSGTLPLGLTLSSSGVLSGTPTAAGTTNFTVTATDASTCTGSRAYIVVVNPAPCPTILIQPSFLPNGTAGQVYSQTITASGGTSPYTFAVTTGTLPSGLSLSSGGILSGVPTIHGNYAFSVTATDSHIPGCMGIGVYTLVIVCPAIALAPASLPDGTIGVAYNQTITASGGTGPYLFATTAGSLPPGVLLSPAGLLSGIPTALGTFSFTVTAGDADGCAASGAYTLVIGCPAITLSPASLPQGTVGVVYNQTMIASGGTGPYTFAVTSQFLPPGLHLSSAGALSGTPASLGTYAFTVTATDTNGCAGGRTYALVIACPIITLLPSSLPSGVAGVPYYQIITASGGTGPYNFYVASGTLPAGLTLSSGGVLSGTPTVSGTFNFTVTACDDNGCTGSQAYNAMLIGCPAIALSPASLPVGTVGLAYSQAITANGGTGPYTFARTLGNLPAGLTLSSGGVLSGTPTTAGIFNFSVTATDTNGCPGTRAYIGTMVNPPVILQMKTTAPCATPFRIFVTGSNLQNGIRVYIDGVQWYSVAWKNTGKIVLKGAIHAAVPPGGTHTFTFVNPDGGVVTRTWRYVLPAKPCGS